MSAADHLIEFPALAERIVAPKPSKLGWNFDGRCAISIPLPMGKREVVNEIDPFPCYAHNLALVAEMAALCEKRFPTILPTVYGVLPFETTSRTNGWATKESIWRAGDHEFKHPYPYIGVILLNGKRIPIHPAMTRYLVVHEYGHIADYHLCRALGLEDNGLDKEYAQMRGIPHDDKYGGGNWHTNIGEVIANDFRISVCGIESEFWPHPYDHPDNVPAVGQWWSDMMLKYVSAPRREDPQNTQAPMTPANE